MVLITHDLGVVAGMADRMLVMYAGKLGRVGHRRRRLLRPADAVHARPAGSLPALDASGGAADADPRRAAVAASTCRRAARSRRAARCRGRTAIADEPDLVRPRARSSTSTACHHGDELVRPRGRTSWFALRSSAVSDAVDASVGADRRPRWPSGDHAPDRVEVTAWPRRRPRRRLRPRAVHRPARPPILSGHRPGQALPGPRRRASSAAASARCRPCRGVSFDLRAGRDARARRRVGLRQVHHRARRAAAASSPRRASVLFEGQELTTLSSPADAPGAAGPADRVPGPVRLAQPAHAGQRHRSPSRCGSIDLYDKRRPRTGSRELLAHRRAQPGARQPLPARVLRRPAPAHRHRPGPRPRPEGDRARRAGVRARRVASRPASSTCSRTSRTELGLAYLFIAHDLSRGPPHLRPGRGDVPRQDRRDRAARRRLRPAGAPVHAGAAVGRAAARPDARAASAGASCSTATCRRPVEPAVGLPLPHPLLEGGADLRARRSRRSSTAARAIPSPATSPRSSQSFDPAVAGADHLARRAPAPDCPAS